MGNHSHTPVEIDEKAVIEAHNMWHGFTKAIQMGLTGVIALLIGMAAFLLH